MLFEIRRLGVAQVAQVNRPRFVRLQVSFTPTSANAGLEPRRIMVMPSDGASPAGDGDGN